MRSLSIIILCHNNNYIDCVINSVKKQTQAADEIIVVDDASSDQVKELIEKCSKGITVLQAKKVGNRANNRNFAAAHSVGDILVFVDGDILLEFGALDEIRTQDFQDAAGICGNVAAMQIVPEEASIILKDYNHTLDWYAEQNFDNFHSIFPDSRMGTQTLPWNRFYSAICAVPRDKFYVAGLFDESLNEWGGEDIDLGYRLSSMGRLIFDSKIRGIHIPHPRNQYKNEITSRNNMYAMLEKYRNQDMEELLSFACLNRAHEALNNVLCEMRKVPDPFDFKAKQKNELCLSIASSLHPQGNISYIADNELVEESFLGLALPFKDHYFDMSTSDTRIFSYPIGLATRIIQELLRVSSMLFIKKIDFPLNISWGDTEEKFKHIFCYYKIKQFCDSYSDFDIKDDGNKFLITLAQKV